MYNLLGRSLYIKNEILLFFSSEPYGKVRLCSLDGTTL